MANKAYLKAADLCAMDEQYLKAAQAYESVAKVAMGNNLTRWSLKDYFLKAGLCYLAGGDAVAAQRQIGQYLEWDSSFQQTREFKLLSDVISAVNDGDSESFADKVYEYDSFSKLDDWKTQVLLTIKKSIVAADDDLL